MAESFSFSKEEEELNLWPAVFDEPGRVKVTVTDLVERQPGESVEHSKRNALSDNAKRTVQNVEEYRAALDNAASELSFEQQKIFVAHYAVYHSVVRAARSVGASVACLKRLKRTDEVFSEMWDLARESWADTLEEVGMDRATADVDPRFAGASNELLKFMLKAENPTLHEDKLTLNVNTIEMRKEPSIDELTDTVKILNEVLGGSQTQQG